MCPKHQTRVPDTNWCFQYIFKTIGVLSTPIYFPDDERLSGRLQYTPGCFQHTPWGFKYTRTLCPCVLDTTGCCQHIFCSSDVLNTPSCSPDDGQLPGARDPFQLSHLFAEHTLDVSNTPLGVSNTLWAIPPHSESFQ